MEDTRFDQLARTLSGASTRRGTLAGLLGGLVVPLLPSAATDAKKKKKKCPPGLLTCKIKKGKRKKKICVNGQTDAANCGACGTICPAGKACCAGACVNTSDDPTHCGSCGTTCNLPQTCGGGGKPGVCGCTPTSCAAEEKNCGSISDGCGGTLDCGGTCPGRETCGGSGTPNVCGCLPLGSLCETSTQCCSLSCCPSETDPVRKCRGGCG